MRTRRRIYVLTVCGLPAWMLLASCATVAPGPAAESTDSRSPAPAAPEAGTDWPQRSPQGFEPLRVDSLAAWQGRPMGPAAMSALSNRESLTARAGQTLQDQADADMQLRWRADQAGLWNSASPAVIQSGRSFSASRPLELFADFRVTPGTRATLLLFGCPAVHLGDRPVGSGGVVVPGEAQPLPLVKADRPLGQLNRLYVRAAAGRIGVWLNDRCVVADRPMVNTDAPGEALYDSGPIGFDVRSGRLTVVRALARSGDAETPLPAPWKRTGSLTAELPMLVGGAAGVELPRLLTPLGSAVAVTPRGEEPLSPRRSARGWTIDLPSPDTTRVRVTLAGSPALWPGPIEAFKDGTLSLEGSQASAGGPDAAVTGEMVTGFTSRQSRAAWEVRVPRRGRYKLMLGYAVAPGFGNSTVRIDIGGQPLEYRVFPTGSWESFVEEEVGSVQLARAGVITVTLAPIWCSRGNALNVRRLVLIPE